MKKSKLALVGAKKPLHAEIQKELEPAFQLVLYHSLETFSRSAAAAETALTLLDLESIKVTDLSDWKRRISSPLSRPGLSRRHPLILFVPPTLPAEKLLYATGLAEDFLLAPWTAGEVAIRVERALARSGGRNKEPLELGPLRLDLVAHRAQLNGRELGLTRRELRLLIALITADGKVVSRAQLVQELTEGKYQIGPRNVDVHVLALRRKLGTLGESITGVRGLGYKLRTPLPRHENNHQSPPFPPSNSR